MRTRVLSLMVVCSFAVIGCDAWDKIFGEEGGTAAGLTLEGCLTAGGVGLSQMPPVVHSVTPWLADIPGLGMLLDQQLTGVAYNITQQFQVAPTIRYYDDAGSPNAFATPTNTEGSSQGTIRVGVNLVAQEARQFLATDYGVTRYYTYSITAVMAHEVAHILQLTRRSLTPSRNTELQADFLAGWYFAYLAANDPNFALNGGLQDGVRAFFSRGDYAFNSVHHHGTPEQRMNAFLAGFHSSANGVNAAWTAAEQFRSSIGG